MAAVEYLKRSLLCSWHAVCKGKWLCTCIWVVNDTLYVTLSLLYSMDLLRRQKAETRKRSKCSNKQKVLLLLGKITNYVRKSHSFTALSVKRWWVRLNFPLPVKVFNGCVPTGAVGTQPGGFHIFVPLCAAPVTGNGFFQLFYFGAVEQWWRQNSGLGHTRGVTISSSALFIESLHYHQK